MSMRNADCYVHTKVHSMHLGLKISGAELALLSVWRREYSLIYVLWRPGGNEMVISTHGPFDLCASGVRQPSKLAPTREVTGVPPA